MAYMDDYSSLFGDAMSGIVAGASGRQVEHGMTPDRTAPLQEALYGPDTKQPARTYGDVQMLPGMLGGAVGRVSPNYADGSPLGSIQMLPGSISQYANASQAPASVSSFGPPKGGEYYGVGGLLDTGASAPVKSAIAPFLDAGGPAPQGIGHLLAPTSGAVGYYSPSQGKDYVSADDFAAGRGSGGFMGAPGFADLGSVRRSMMYNMNDPRQLGAWQQGEQTIAANQAHYANQLALEQLRGQNELARTLIASGQGSRLKYIGDVGNSKLSPEARRTANQEGFENGAFTPEERDRNNLSIDITNPQTGQEFPLAQPRSSGAPNPLQRSFDLWDSPNDPRSAMSADFGILSKVGKNASPQAIQQFVADRKIDQGMIQNRLYELLHKNELSRSPYAEGFLGYGAHPDLNADEKNELDFILRKFGNPEMQKKGIDAFIPR